MNLGRTDSIDEQTHGERTQGKHVNRENALTTHSLHTCRLI